MIKVLGYSSSPNCCLDTLSNASALLRLTIKSRSRAESSNVCKSNEIYQ